MPLIITDPGAVSDFPTPITVDYIDYLGAPGGWVNIPYLRVDKLKIAANAYDECDLSYVIGSSVQQVGSVVLASYSPLSLKTKFVRVTIPTATGNIEWVGYVATDNVKREGVKAHGGVNKLEGRVQQIKAVGLEWFLDRKQITQAVIYIPEFLGLGTEVTIERPMTFNGGLSGSPHNGVGTRGNRSDVTGPSGVHCFTDSFETAPLWTARQIVEHVVQFYCPKESGGNDAPCDFALHGDDTGFLDGFYPTIASEGMTIYQILNKICSPQRGLVWWTEYTETLFPKLLIRVQSAAQAVVSLPGGGTLPANTKQNSLNFDADVDVRSVNLRQIGFRDYHKVVVRGARMTSTCTVGVGDGTLVGDWSVLTGPDDPGTEKKYKEAAKNDADYAGLDDAKKKARNDAFRRADAFHRVYSCFRIPTTWDGKTGDGGGGQKDYALPVLSPTGSILGALAKSVQGLRMLNTLRLKFGWDYSNPTTPKSVAPPSSVAQMAPPFAFFKVATSPDRFQLADKMRQSDFAAGSKLYDAKTCYHPFMQQSVPGIRLVANGALPHVMAKTAWAAAPLPEPSATVPEVDYSNLRATVCIEADAFCEGIYPTVGYPANTPLQTLMIDAGEEYRLDFLAANTITGLNNGLPIKSANAVVLRDDRKYLEDVAKLAYQWYQVNRFTMEVTYRQVLKVVELGMLITTIGSGATVQTINTVVSSLTYDVINGTTTVETEDATLDIRSVIA